MSPRLYRTLNHSPRDLQRASRNLNRNCATVIASPATCRVTLATHLPLSETQFPSRCPARGAGKLRTPTQYQASEGHPDAEGIGQVSNASEARQDRRSMADPWTGQHSTQRRLASHGARSAIVIVTTPFRNGVAPESDLSNAETPISRIVTEISSPESPIPRSESEMRNCFYVIGSFTRHRRNLF